MDKYPEITIAPGEGHKPRGILGDKHWDIKKLQEWWHQLKKNPDGSVKITHKGREQKLRGHFYLIHLQYNFCFHFLAGDSLRRLGMTDCPFFIFLDPTESYPTLHAWIRAFYCFWRLFANLNARDSFPKRTPTMRGQKKGPVINAKIEEERQKLITKAAKKPISLLVDSPCNTW